MLTTPGLFDGGWRPDGIPAALVAASVSRAETISGWDLVTNKPKPAQRVAPTGSVYWFENFSGDLNELKALVQNGFPIADPAHSLNTNPHTVAKIMMLAMCSVQLENL